MCADPSRVRVVLLRRENFDRAEWAAREDEDNKWNFHYNFAKISEGSSMSRPHRGSHPAQNEIWNLDMPLIILSHSVGRMHFTEIYSPFCMQSRHHHRAIRSETFYIWTSISTTLDAMFAQLLKIPKVPPWSEFDRKFCCMKVVRTSSRQLKKVSFHDWCGACNISTLMEFHWLSHVCSININKAKFTIKS